MEKSKQSPKEQPKQPEKPKELLIPMFAEEHFVDGNLFSFFKDYGYAGEWPRNEVREIPLWLINRVIQSGGVLTRADD